MVVRTFLTATCVAGLATIAAAQDFDARSFEDAVNEAISEMPGVSFTVTDKSNPTMFKIWAAPTVDLNLGSRAVENAPPFGFVVFDAKGRSVEVFGESAPFRITNNTVEITGYNLPEGYSVSTVGAAGYIEAISRIAQRVEAPSSDIENAVKSVKRASAYIVQELCKQVGRPTEITLNLTAGFSLAFTVETGSQFHWDLEVVCLR
jgi:hypothetical protein